MSATQSASDPFETDGGLRVWYRELIRVTTGHAEKVLASPWQKNTSALRVLLLTTSVALGFWLAGLGPVGPDFFKGLATLQTPAPFHLLASLLLLYAITAYGLAARTDIVLHRLMILGQVTDYRTTSLAVEEAFARRREQFELEQKKREPGLKALEAKRAAREEYYAREFAAVEAATRADPLDEVAEEKWWNLHRRQRQELDSHYERVEALWNGVDAHLLFIAEVNAKLKALETVPAPIIEQALRRRRWEYWIECIGPLLLGIGVLGWSALATIVLYGKL